MVLDCFLKEESIENILSLYKYDWKWHKKIIQIEKNKWNVWIFY